MRTRFGDVVETLESKEFGCIRQDTDKGKHWLDVGTISGCQAESRLKAKEVDNQIPDWSNVNPVVAVAELRILSVYETR